MFWSARPQYGVEDSSSSLLAGVSQSFSTPAPRIDKVIAARQAVIHHDFDEENMLDQIVNSLTSDALAT